MFDFAIEFLESKGEDQGRNSTLHCEKVNKAVSLRKSHEIPGADIGHSFVPCLS